MEFWLSKFYCMVSSGCRDKNSCGGYDRLMKIFCGNSLCRNDIGSNSSSTNRRGGSSYGRNFWSRD